MSMRKTKMPPQGKNLEYPIPAKEAALNERNYGGNTIPNFPDETTVVKLPASKKGGPRNTDGLVSKYPIQVSRPGERRI